MRAVDVKGSKDAQAVGFTGWNLTQVRGIAMTKEQVTEVRGYMQQVITENPAEMDIGLKVNPQSVRLFVTDESKEEARKIAELAMTKLKEVLKIETPVAEAVVTE